MQCTFLQMVVELYFNSIISTVIVLNVMFNPFATPALFQAKNQTNKLTIG